MSGLQDLINLINNHHKDEGLSEDVKEWLDDMKAELKSCNNIDDKIELLLYALAGILENLKATNNKIIML